MAAVTRHGAVPWYEGAYGCGHPEPPEDAPERDEWDADHPWGTEGERVCLLTPAGVCCPACTEVAAEEEDLPEGEYVACRVVTAEGT
jgi:hypothetical protein